MLCATAPDARMLTIPAIIRSFLSTSVICSVPDHLLRNLAEIGRSRGNYGAFSQGNWPRQPPARRGIARAGWFRLGASVLVAIAARALPCCLKFGSLQKLKSGSRTIRSPARGVSVFGLEQERLAPASAWGEPLRLATDRRRGSLLPNINTGNVLCPKFHVVRL